MNPAQNQIRIWREDPVQFVRDNFKIEPDDWQVEMLQAFASRDTNKQRIAMQACAGPGKTAGLAWIGWNFLTCYADKGEHPKGAAVSITSDNLKDNLWPELAKWRERSEFLTQAFEWQKQRIFARDHPETWFLSARSWSKTANEEEQGRTLSGLHSEFILYLIDESGDIPPAVLRSAEQGLTNCKFGKILQAGNPTSHHGMLYLAAQRQADRWHVIRITGDPKDPKRSKRIDVEQAQTHIDDLGRDNPWVMSYILGRFPPTSWDSLLGIDDINDAMGRHYQKDRFEFAQKRLGIDVARFGDDRTVFAPRQGLVAYPMEEMRNARSNEIAGRAMQAKEKWNYDIEFVDGTGGYGAGVVDSLLNVGHEPLEINFAGKALDPRFANKRVEMWWNMCEWVKRGGALPKDEQLAKELAAPTYNFIGSKITLESKEQIKKRLGFSPDKADALALTFAIPEATTIDSLSLNNGHGLNGGEKIKAEYDPFDEDRW